MARQATVPDVCVTRLRRSSQLPKLGAGALGVVTAVCYRWHRMTPVLVVLWTTVYTRCTSTIPMAHLAPRSNDDCTAAHVGVTQTRAVLSWRWDRSTCGGSCCPCNFATKRLATASCSGQAQWAATRLPTPRAPSTVAVAPITTPATSLRAEGRHQAHKEQQRKHD